MATRWPRSGATYRAWHAMIQRCLKPTHRQYADYGVRGITVCDRWRSFDNFVADMGERPDGLSLDRIDNDGAYEPGNCRWATVSEQARNRRNTKLTLDKVDQVRQMKGLPQRTIARLIGIDQSHVSRILNGERWT